MEARSAAARRAKGALRLGVSAGLLLVLLSRADFGEVVSLLGRGLAQWPLLAAAALLPAGGCLAAAVRWRLLLSAVGARPRVSSLYGAFLIGSFFNHFFPSTIGGDVMRGWWMQRSVGSTAASIAVVGLDRLMGLLGLCAVALFAGALHPGVIREIPAFWAGIGAVSGAAAGMVALTRPRAGDLARRVFAAIRLGGLAEPMLSALARYRDQKARLLVALLLSVAWQLLVILEYLLLAKALGLAVGAWVLAVIVPIATLITLLPVTINGIGLREGALAVLGAGFGLGTHDAIALAWLFVLLGLPYAATGGVLYALTPEARSQPAGAACGSDTRSAPRSRASEASAAR